MSFRIRYQLRRSFRLLISQLRNPPLILPPRLTNLRIQIAQNTGQLGPLILLQVVFRNRMLKEALLILHHPIIIINLPLKQYRFLHPRLIILQHIRQTLNILRFPLIWLLDTFPCDFVDVIGIEDLGEGVALL